MKLHEGELVVFDESSSVVYNHLLGITNTVSNSLAVIRQEVLNLRKQFAAVVRSRDGAWKKYRELAHAARDLLDLADYESDTSEMRELRKILWSVQDAKAARQAEGLSE